MMRMRNGCVYLVVLAILSQKSAAADPDLAEYRTVETAIKTRPAKAQQDANYRPGYLGLHLAPNPDGKLAIAEVAHESPAARAGIRSGDLLMSFDGANIKDEDTFHDLLRSKTLGNSVRLGLRRGAELLNISATLDAPNRPMIIGRPKAVLGVRVAPVTGGEGLKIEVVDAGSAAERAKLKVGEIILKVDDVAVGTAEKLIDLVTAKSPGDFVTLTLIVAEKTVEMKVRLGGERAADGAGDRRPQAFGPGGRYWTKPVFRLGIIGVEYPDVKHNPNIPPSAWEDAMFSKGTYTKTSVTGQPVHGSMNDYYIEQSLGALRIEGKAFDYVEVSKKRADYAIGDKAVFLREAMEKLVERDKDALKGLDGVFFIFAGDRFQVPRGSLYWPHRSNVSFQGERWPYFICPEGGPRMTNNSVFCHEFGHMLGLPDLYARPENPGMEGAGVWSAMANQVGNGRPQHFDAWSKEKLGWIKPAVIDPTIKQKLILSPVEDSAKECFKIPIRGDGSEYFLLENRRKKGFDVSLPADGLLIWRVVGNRPILEESHGVTGPNGPRVFLDKVPYPTVANDAFTPYTTPSSRSQLGGGTPVYITNITKRPDGWITFHIGYEYH